MTVKLSDLKAGDLVQVDDGFTCMRSGPRYVRVDKEDGRLYVHCAAGKHFLEGQLADDGTLVGVCKNAPVS